MKKKKKSIVEYTCGTCDATFKAKPGLSVKCNKCRRNFKHESPYPESEEGDEDGSED